MLTLEEFQKIPSGTDFDYGLAVDNYDSLNMAGSGRQLKWIAVKGWADDWCIYAHFAENDYGFVKEYGDKVMGEEHIMKLIPCDDFVFARYRY
jgi:hypothetical protein